MATRGLPLDYDIVIYVGASYKREFRWLPDGVTPLDFTGWDAHMFLGQPANLAEMELSVASGEITLTSDGKIVVVIGPARTAVLHTSSTNWYNLDLTDPSGFVRRFLHGRVSVVYDVRLPSP